MLMQINYHDDKTKMIERDVNLILFEKEIAMDY